MIVRVFLLLLLAVPAFARSYGDFDVAAPPRWVEPVGVAYDHKVARDSVRFGLFDLLSDHQVHVSDVTTTRYHRTTRKVLSTSGVQNASEISIAFDPAYQRLIIHEVLIVRDGRRINALKPDEVRVIENETEADSQIYDGELTALIFLDDVRPGDVLDYSWSLDGANPILRGKFAGEFELSSAVPTRHLRHRLLWPEGRPLRTSGGEAILPVQSSSEGKEGQAGLPVLHYVWERFNVEPIDIDDDAPGWFDPWQTIQVSEFQSWAEVAQWAVSMFQADEDSITAIEDLAGKIREVQPNPADRITAAIRFVQDDIRYLGIEIGQNSHEPRQPAQTLAQRWGDCKEKAFVLAMLLRELGVNAQPALVSTRYRHMLDKRLPSPFAFDHVIVRAQSGGKTHWIDPTVANQGGTLETIDAPDDERALVVSEQTTRLAKIAPENHGRIAVEQTYTARDESTATRLDVKTTYTGSYADDVRAALASMSATDLARDRINHYAADHPEIAAAGAPKVTDDRDRNTIVLSEHYRIRGMWKNGQWTFYPRAVESQITRPATIVRTSPLAIDPLDVEQRTTFRFPARVRTIRHETAHASSALRFTSRVRGSGNAITVDTSIRSLRDAISAREVPQHLNTINAIRDTIGVTIRPPFDDAGGGLGRRFAQAGALSQWGSAGAVLALIVAAGFGIVQAVRSLTRHA